MAKDIIKGRLAGSDDILLSDLEIEISDYVNGLIKDLRCKVNKEETICVTE